MKSVFYQSFLCIVFILGLFYSGFGQNKTLGVGIATPNPNAALHVESPTANQGMIMPRLTTAERLAMILTAADKGLSVYDTDLNTMITWDGTAWSSAARLVYPYSDNVTTATGTPDLFKLAYDNPENKRVVRIENNNPTNGSSALSVLNQGTGIVGFFQINNPASSSPAIMGTTNSDIGGPLAPPGVFGESTGTGSVGGAFRIQNPGNPFAALFAESVGSGSSFLAEKNSGGGHAIQGLNAGSVDGSAGVFTNTQPTNTFSALFAESAGSGPSFFAIKNSGGGHAIQGVNAGSGDGFAGVFSNTQPTNTFPAIQATTQGTGSAIRAFMGAADGDGPGIDIFMQKTTNLSPGLSVNSDHAGTGIDININGTTNTNPALNIAHAGDGATALFLNHNGATGNLAVLQSGGANVARRDKTGQGFFNGGTVSSGADLAEVFEVEGAVETYEPGDVLIISEKTDRTVEKSSGPNSRKVAGVYATKPGVLLTEKGIDDDLGNTIPMGVIGVIPTKVCLENGPIHRGDLLVTSSQSGKAMKALPTIINGVEIYPQGAILGKALENFDGTGSPLINVLVNVK